MGEGPAHPNPNPNPNPNPKSNQTLTPVPTLTPAPALTPTLTLTPAHPSSNPDPNPNPNPKVRHIVLTDARAGPTAGAVSSGAGRGLAAWRRAGWEVRPKPYRSGHAAPTTYYLLLATYYLLQVRDAATGAATPRLLLTTYYLLLATCYELLTTDY
jgi:hypothetical protein